MSENFPEKEIYPELYKKITPESFELYKQKISKYGPSDVLLLAGIYLDELNFDPTSEPDSDLEPVIEEVRLLLYKNRGWVSAYNIPVSSFPRIHLQMYSLRKIPLYMTIKNKFLKSLVRWRLFTGI